MMPLLVWCFVVIGVLLSLLVCCGVVVVGLMRSSRKVKSISVRFDGDDKQRLDWPGLCI